jgi:hypothetical protein
MPFVKGHLAYPRRVKLPPMPTEEVKPVVYSGLTTTTDPIEEKPTLTVDQLNAELLNVDDLFQRALVPYFLLGETARSIRSDKLEGSRIEVGTYQKNITKEVLDTFTDYIVGTDVIINTEGFSYTNHDGVPVVARFLVYQYTFLDNPEFVFYLAGEYFVPNPFEKYWLNKDVLE